MAPASAALSITEERTYSAKLGDRTVTGLAVSSAWEGFTKYTDRAGQHLIVLDAEQRVITASPHLVAQLGIEYRSVGLPQIGESFGGGYFTGVIAVGGKNYALITAGREGELGGKWNGAYNGPAAPDSRCDGASNTLTMVAAGSALAKRVMDMNLNGYADWYIPSRDELELMYRAFKPTDRANYADGEDGINPNSSPAGTAYTKAFPVQTTVSAFKPGGVDAFDTTWYWSSTQHASDPSNAWGQDFVVGGQNYNHKDNEGRVRVVRRLPI